jgi:hypothetical protein
VLVTQFVPDVQLGRDAARPEHTACGREERARLRFAVAGLVHRVGVDAERHVVQKQPPVDLPDVDPPLDAVREGVERPDQVAPVDPEVEREVVSRTGRNADERDVVLVRSRRHQRERSVAARHAERIRAVGNGFLDERRQTLTGL